MIAAVACRVHAQNDLTDIPEPDPAAEAAQMQLASGAEVNLFAADPVIRKPIQMNFDATGQLWVAISEVYPQIRPGEVANDKIIVLHDSDRDGTLDQHRVFADGLLIPTGVIPDGPDACYVAASTELLHLRDTDGDGKADERRIVFSGFGTEDTHHLLHTLRWGPDGCLYFNQSIYIHSHIETADGVRRLDGGGVWRYRPSNGKLEILCKGFVNPWGHVFDRFGESFVTDGAYFEGINYVFPDSVFATSPGAERWLSGLNPGSPKHCGLEILSGDHIPPSWDGDLLTNDFRSHRVCRFTVRPNASGYLSRQQPEVLTTSHVAFRPIDVRMGPDGAIYIADWYNPIIQHGEVDFRDERRDREHGRIWRISFPDRPLDLWPDVAGMNDEALLASLEDTSLAVRQFARQELWRRGSSNPDRWSDAAQNWLGQAGDEATRATRGLEWQWLREAWQIDRDSSSQDIAAIISDAGGRTIRPLLRSLWRQGYLRDPSHDTSVTRLPPLNDAALLEIIVCNGQWASDAAADRLIELLKTRLHDIREQQNLDFAMWQSLRNTQSHWSGVDASTDRWREHPSALAYAITAAGTTRAARLGIQVIENRTNENHAASDEQLWDAVLAYADAPQLGQLLDIALARSDVRQRASLLSRIVEATRSRKLKPVAASELLRTAVERTSENDQAWWNAVAMAVATWQLRSLENDLLDRFAQADSSTQTALIRWLVRFDGSRAERLRQSWLTHSDLDTRLAAMDAMIDVDAEKAVEPLVATLLEDPLQDDADRGAAIGVATRMFARRGVPAKLAASLNRSAQSGRQLDADLARQLLRSAQSAGTPQGLLTAVRTLGKLDDAGWKWTPEFRDRILSGAMRSGSPRRGQAIYRRESLQCINCHAIGTAGGLIGPNLISLGGSSQPDYILESLIVPDAKLKEGYETRKVLTEDGEVIAGIKIGETADDLRLRLADGKEVSIAIDQIVEELPGKSLMPAGIVDPLTEAELQDLVAFLAALGREPAYSVSTEPVVRSFESLIYSNEANRRLNRTSTDTVAKDDPLMNWRHQTTLVDGMIPLSELDQFKQHRQTPPTSFVRFSVDMPQTGAAGIRVPTDGLEAWVDGRPTPVWNLDDLELAAGEHTIVLAIDRSTVQDDFAIGLEGDAVATH